MYCNCILIELAFWIEFFALPHCLLILMFFLSLLCEPNIVSTSQSFRALFCWILFSEKLETLIIYFQITCFGLIFCEKKTCSRLDQWLSKTVVCPQWSRYGPTSISHLLAISLKNTATQQMFKKNIYFATPLYICVV